MRGILRGTADEEERFRVQPNRLETPDMTGFRHGMTSQHVIGRKLGQLYDLPGDDFAGLDQLLHALDRKADGSTDSN